MPQTPRSEPRESLGSVRTWSISDGSLEALKWVALTLMMGDHVNKYLLEGARPVLYETGRLAMPLFGFVLMAHLTRTGALQTGMHLRVMKRLAIFTLMATPAFIHLVGWWPLNIMATLFMATLIVWLHERGGRARSCAAPIAFLLGGALVEFWWPALLYCLGAWAFLRRPDTLRLLLWSLATATLAVVNGNFVAVAAMPLIWGVSRFDVPLTRCRWIFYVFYPAHLSLIALVQQQV
jgi:TraX protein